MTKLGRILRRLIPFLALISPKADAIEQAPQEPSPAIAALIETIAGASSATREKIANTLARMGEPSIEPLIAASRHRDPKVRGVAARALELLGKDAKRAVAALIASLGDPEPADDPKPTRSSNIPGFGRDGEPRPSPQQRALREIGEPAIGSLLLLDRPDHHARVLALRALGFVYDEKKVTFPRLIALLEDQALRLEAAAALGGIDPAPRLAIPRLLTALRDPSDQSSVAANAAKAIAAISPENNDEFTDRLFARLADPNPEVSKGAVSPIWALGPKTAPRLWRLFSDPKTSRPVRARVLDLLVSEFAELGSRSEGKASSLGPDVERAMPLLRELVRGGDREMAGLATKLLGSMLVRDDEIAQLYVDTIRPKHPRRWLYASELTRKLKPAMIPFFVAKLNDPDTEIRAELLRIMAPQVRAFPVPSTDYDDDEVPPKPTPEELEAMSRAAQIKVQTARAVLPFLKDPAPPVRWNAAALLGQLGVEADLVVPALRAMVLSERILLERNDRMIFLEELASNYLGMRVYRLRGNWPEVNELRIAAIGALGRFAAEGAAAVPDFITILRTDKDARTRWFTAEALRRIGPAAAEAVPALLELLSSGEPAEPPAEKTRDAGVDPDPRMPLKVAAAVALGGIGPPARAAVADPVRELADDDARVRAEAAWALGQIGPDAAAAIPRLVKLTAEETDDNTADLAVHSLGRIGAAAVPALTERIKAGEGDVRIRFLTALGEVGPSAASAMPELLRAIADPAEEVRAAAVLALGFIRNGKDSAKGIPVLISALKDSDNKVRDNAVWGLIRIGPKNDQVIPALVSALRDSNPEVSSDASYALCKIGIPAMPAIMASFGDAGPELSGRVEYLISEIVRGNPNLRPAGETEEQTPARIKAARFILLEGLKNPNERIRDKVADLLADLGDSIIPDLIAALGDASPLLRAGAAQTLELTGPKARPALDALRKCLNDPDAAVRAAADSAIKAIQKANP